jgi:hypothetical protein
MCPWGLWAWPAQQARATGMLHPSLPIRRAEMLRVPLSQEWDYKNVCNIRSPCGQVMSTLVRPWFDMGAQLSFCSPPPPRPSWLACAPPHPTLPYR